MALMSFREANQVLWRGVRPAHNGTQVIYDINTAVIAEHVLFTSGAGIYHFICNCWIASTDNLAQELTIRVYNDAPAIIGSLYYGRSSVGYKGINQNLSFWPPFEFSPGFSLRVNVSAATWCSFGCSGWSE